MWYQCSRSLFLYLYCDSGHEDVNKEMYFFMVLVPLRDKARFYVKLQVENYSSSIFLKLSVIFDFFCSLVFLFLSVSRFFTLHEECTICWY